jgi:hypothetical protein
MSESIGARERSEQERGVEYRGLTVYEWPLLAFAVLGLVLTLGSILLRSVEGLKFGIGLLPIGSASIVVFLGVYLPRKLQESARRSKEWQEKIEGKLDAILEKLNERKLNEQKIAS